jgi:hypothetical protein
METNNVPTVSWDVDFASMAKEELTVSFSKYPGPTELFNFFMNKPVFSSSVHAYSTDSTDAFLISRDLALKILDSQTHAGDLMQATRQVFESVLTGRSQLPDALVDQIKRHALALAKTSPEVFGSNFKLNLLARRGEFSFPARNEDGYAHERYDIVQWIVCIEILGKAFDLEGWEPMFATCILPPHDPKDVVIRVSLGGPQERTLDVTHEAKQAMDLALVYLGGKPPAFFHCKQSALAVALILGKELLAYTMPQSVEFLESFDWGKVIVGNYTTYPVAPSPTASEFAVVKVVHKECKAGKDAEARANGIPRSGAPGYESVTQKLRTFRNHHAVYRTMYPKEDIHTIHDRVLIALKGCNSVAHMQVVVDEEITRFLATRARAKKNAQLAEEMAARLEEAKAAEAKASQLEAERAEAEKQLAASTTPKKTGVLSTLRRTRHQQVATRMKEAEQEAKALKAREDALAAVQKRIQEAADEANRKRMERESLRKEKQKLDAKEAKLKLLEKKARRNDTSRLDLDPSPRKKAKTNANWDPPLWQNGVYRAPGDDWKDASIKKLQLLSALRNQLTASCMLDKPMTLATVMEFVGADQDETTFQERVFLFLMCLIIAQTRYVHGPTVAIILVAQSFLCI